MFDMLGRAKHDAWAKQKDLGTREAKLQYVETLVKVMVLFLVVARRLPALWQVLRKYSDRTVAMDLVQELESYGDPSDVIMSSKETDSVSRPYLTKAHRIP